MARATSFVAALLILLTLSAVVRAEPILYTTSGQIRLSDGAYEDFQGSFVLSDPVTSFYDLSDSRGDQADRYTISDFILSSASYSLAGSGSIGVWWSLYRSPTVWLNTLDSVVVFDTSAGRLESYESEFPTWEGAPGTQPIRFYGLSTSYPYGVYPRIANLTAERADNPVGVPEPSTLLLYGVGLIGTALLKRRA